MYTNRLCRPSQKLPASFCIVLLFNVLNFVDGWGDIGKIISHVADSIKCDPGQHTQSQKCRDCPTGWYQPEEGQDKCMMCKAGMFASQQSSTDCVSCEPRSYSSAGQAKCEFCPEGYYSSETNTVECNACQPGFFAAAASLDATSCDAGKYADVEALGSCKSCGEDQYQDEIGQATCKLCEEGKTTLGVGQPSCVSLEGSIECNLGEFNLNSVCEVCPAGMYSDSTQLTACIDCPEGRYLKDSGEPAANLHDSASDCLQCEAGMYQSQAGQNTCKICTGGKYQDKLGKSFCRACDKGRYIVPEPRLPTRFDSQERCSVCSFGQYNDELAAGYCKECPPGRWNNDDDISMGEDPAISHDHETDCISCDEGHFSEEVGFAGPCIECPAGFHTLWEIRSSCTPCTPGTYADSNALHGESACTVCENGLYSTVEGSSACTFCGAGRHIPGSKTSNHDEESDCQVCLPGMYTEEQGAKSCLNCPLGRFLERHNDVAPNASMHAALSACLICPEGRYNEKPGLDRSCAKCAAGTFLSDNGADPLEHDDGLADCKVCPAGRINRVLGSALCSACPAGFFNGYEPVHAIDHEACLRCPKGYFTGGTGLAQTACEACERGYYNNVYTATSSALCISCPRGFYSDSLGSALCKGCTRGKYGIVIQAVNVSIACINCKAGMSSEVGQADICTNCSAGFYLPREVAGTGAVCLRCEGIENEGATECPGCPEGMWGNEPSCQNCSAGRYSEGGKSEGCDDCPAGYFSKGSAFHCDACPSGRWSNVVGMNHSSDCKECGKGRHGNNEEGATSSLSCIQCEPGTFSDLIDAVGVWNCIECEPGYVSNIRGRQSPCDACNPGQYSRIPGETASCKSCPRGWSAEFEGAGSCQMCIPGYAQGSIGSTTCTPCPVGQFAELSESWTCAACPSGYYQNRNAKASCLPCVPGTRAHYSKSTHCSTCSKGKFSDVSAFNESTCKPCPPGTFQGRDSSSACIPCAPGSFANQSSSLSCEICREGKYVESPGHSHKCDSCPSGHYQGRIGATTCIPCSPGKHQVSRGIFSCSNCDSGRFADQGGTSSACARCPRGFHQISPGSTTCNACQPGKFQRSLGELSCESCPNGFYVRESKAVQCLQCPQGQFTPARERATSCQTCLAGRAAGPNASCLLCLPGRFRAVLGSPIECVDCPSGYANQHFGQSYCQKCTVGKISSDDGEFCIACSPGMYRGDQDSTCLPCSPGFFSEKPESTFCLHCDAGTFASTANSESCASCREGQYQDEKRSVTCKQCSGGLVPNAQQTACERPLWKIPSDCKIGEEFLNDTQLDWKTWTCDQCPRFSLCKGHVSWRDVVPMPGSKRLRANEKFFAPCPVFSSCDWPALAHLHENNSRENSSMNIYDSCADGHDPHSELCSQCLEGWSKPRENVPCSKCPEKTTTIFVSIGVFLFIGFVFNALVTDSLNGSKDMIPRSECDTSHSTEMPFHSIAIRILSSYMQVSGMLLAFDVYIPESVRSLIVAQSSVSSLGEQLLSFECLVESRKGATIFFMKQLFAAWILPFSSLVLIAIFWWLRHVACQRDGLDDEDHILRMKVSDSQAPKKRGGRKTQKEQFVANNEFNGKNNLQNEVYIFVPSVDGFLTTIVVLFYTLYPSLVNRMALTFSCVSWDNGESEILTEALSVKCWTPEHMALVYQVGIPGSILYMVLIPAAISLILNRERRRQHLYPHQRNYQARWTMRFSFMFAGYREGFEWWESVVMARKCLFVLMAIFLRLYGPSAQVLAASIVLCMAISLHLQYRPYFDQGLNWLESMSLQVSLAQLLTAILANVLTHGRASSSTKAVSSTSNMGPIANLVTIIFFFSSTFVFFLCMLRETIRGSYESKGCIGNTSRCCLNKCHRHVFGSHTIAKRNSKARRHSRKQKKGTRSLYMRFFKAVKVGVSEANVHNVEEEHDQSLKIYQKRVKGQNLQSRKRLQKRLATRKATLASTRGKKGVHQATKESVHQATKESYLSPKNRTAKY